MDSQKSLAQAMFTIKACYCHDETQEHFFKIWGLRIVMLQRSLKIPEVISRKTKLAHAIQAAASERLVCRCLAVREKAELLSICTSKTERAVYYWRRVLSVRMF